MGKGLRTVNLEAGMPTCEQAIQKLTFEIHQSRLMGFKILKIIHGYGSSGVGGKLRVEIRAYLERQLKSGKVKAVEPGESFTIFSETTRRILSICPELRGDRDLEWHNNGITFILL